MATRDSVDQLLHEVEAALQSAEGMYMVHSKQSSWEDVSFQQTQQQLQEMSEKVAKMVTSADDMQKEALNRAQIRIERMQQKMLITDL
ncbi:DUF2524 family protein [Aureibacillus halotolerans]|uniref:Uncharacterized protein DUF2524 n=1 Tax=Aureibacillus halotolerans TaxID=1508390 RepID=A0A4R6U1K5_9BACI|nr:DUF2524 family protein [Aureibacillus halotolerans]TDQ40288.1 uncharacterized protein DUF2524 [Aureibacillus halotolerans]